MASPHSEAVYCFPNTSKGWEYRGAYAGTSIASATVSLIGSVYMLFTWGPYLKAKLKFRRPLLHPSRHIVFFLALSDVIACLAVIGRSVTLLLIQPAIPINGSTCTEDHPQNCNSYRQHYWSFGIAVELAMRFGYSATFLWTFFYAVDSFMKVKQKALLARFYHILIWPAAALFAAANEVTLFAGNLKHCSGKVRLTVSYLLVYGPMMTVVIVNPILYTKTSRRFIWLLKGSGQFTQQERDVAEEQRRKFLFLVIVFYVCWLPSLISGAYEIGLLYSGHLTSLPLAIWLVNAVCNPLQGLLNSIAYGKPNQTTLFTKTSTSEQLVTPNTQKHDWDDDDGDSEFLISDEGWSSEY